MPRGGYEWGVVFAVAAVVLLAIALDLGSDADDERAVRFSAADVERVAQRVERMRGLRFEHPVRPLFLDRDEAAKLVRENARSEYPEREQRVDEEGLKLLGLLRPSVDLGKVTDQVSEEQILGFYDDRSGRLVVIRDSGATRPLLEITLAHELVHALEDQRFGLDLPEGVPDDSVLSESALAEGTATSLMVDYADRYLNLGQTLELASLPEAKGLPPFIEKQLLFPYLEGEKFVNVFRGENGEWGPVNAILRFRRPRTSEQILHPRTYAADERPQHVGAPDLRAALGSGWRRLRATSLGEYDLRLLIDLGGGTRPIAGADGWGGGRFELWRRGPAGDPCRAPCVSRDVAFMRVRWDTARDRAEAESQLVRVFEEGLRGRRAAVGAGVGVWGSRGGTIAMRGRGRETTVVFAPDERLAARALRASPASGT
jgi:hypothetical protein